MRPLQFMLDSNVFDRLMTADSHADISLALRNAGDTGRIRLLITHIQVDEILDTPDDALRRGLMHTVMRAGVREVPTAGFYFDKSRLGHARLADDGTHARIEAFMHGNRNELDDALIAATAAEEGAILVTEERKVARYGHHFRGLEVWKADQLIEAARKWAAEA